jgi:hypothetical protein
VLWLTPKVLAMSRMVSPCASRALASSRWQVLSEGLRPNRCPRALALARPSVVRATIKLRSNWPMAPRTFNSNWPWAVVVSSAGLSSTLNPASRLATASNVLSRSLVERAALPSMTKGK